MERETIEYRGKKYHRYPLSKRRQLRVYYWRHDAWKKPPFALHRQIWIDNNGEIPEGYVIHHKDNNPLNNDIDNLQLEEKGIHMSKHMLSEERRQKSIENGKKQSARLIKQLREWRENNPDIAHEVYSRNGKKQWKKAKKQLLKWCEDNKEKHREICSKNGKRNIVYLQAGLKKWREENPDLYKELNKNNIKSIIGEPKTAICKECGKTFTYRRKTGAKYCSNSCGAKSRRRNRLQPIS